jgi:hypothetical protein
MHKAFREALDQSWRWRRRRHTERSPKQIAGELVRSAPGSRWRRLFGRSAQPSRSGQSAWLGWSSDQEGRLTVADLSNRENRFSRRASNSSFTTRSDCARSGVNEYHGIAVAHPLKIACQPLGM